MEREKGKLSLKCRSEDRAGVALEQATPSVPDARSHVHVARAARMGEVVKN